MFHLCPSVAEKIPVLKLSGLDYLSPMRQLRNFIWTLTAVVVLVLAAYLTFTAARWLNHASGLRFWNTTSVVRVSFDILPDLRLESPRENDNPWSRQARHILHPL